MHISSITHHASRITLHAHASPTGSVTGYESLQAVYEVDQSPIGRTPRSIPATYVGFFDDIRQLFAQVPEARLRGYSPSRFSFNSAQGRCPECEGAGTIKLEMNFLPPGVRALRSLRRHTLQPRDAGHRVSRQERRRRCWSCRWRKRWSSSRSLPRIKRALAGAVRHGPGLPQARPDQPHAQRRRGPAREAGQPFAGRPEGAGRAERPRARRNLFILEEPTIGLHMADVQRLVEVLQRLVDGGHSVIVIEHNLDFIAEADWVIDLGPEGGEGGGRIVAEGTPEHVAAQQTLAHGTILA